MPKKLELSDRIIKEIKSYRKKKLSYAKIETLIKHVSDTTAWRIANGRRYKHKKGSHAATKSAL